MTVIAAFFAFLIFIFVVWPLFEEARSAGVPVEPRRDSADLILDQIEDLELEHAAGKISDENFAKVRNELVGEAAEVLNKK